MFCWIKNLWDIPWIGLKVKIIEQELMKSTKFDKTYIQNNGYDGLTLGY